MRVWMHSLLLVSIPATVQAQDTPMLWPAPDATSATVFVISERGQSSGAVESNRRLIIRGTQDDPWWKLDVRGIIGTEPSAAQDFVIEKVNGDPGVVSANTDVRIRTADGDQYLEIRSDRVTAGSRANASRIVIERIDGKDGLLQLGDYIRLRSSLGDGKYLRFVPTRFMTQSLYTAAKCTNLGGNCAWGNQLAQVYLPSTKYGYLGHTVSISTANPDPPGDAWHLNQGFITDAQGRVRGVWLQGVVRPAEFLTVGHSVGADLTVAMGYGVESPVRTPSNPEPVKNGSGNATIVPPGPCSGHLTPQGPESRVTVTNVYWDRLPVEIRIGNCPDPAQNRLFSTSALSKGQSVDVQTNALDVWVRRRSDPSNEASPWSEWTHQTVMLGSHAYELRF